MPDSFFKLRVMIEGFPNVGFPDGSCIDCGPYITYVEAARVMMEGLDIVLAPYKHELNKLVDPIVCSQIIEYALIDNGQRIERLEVKSEERRAL